MLYLNAFFQIGSNEGVRTDTSRKKKIFDVILKITDDGLTDKKATTVTDCFINPSSTNFIKKQSKSGG